ncbi:MAG: hypothetical protein PHX77_06860 [Candidatus Bipolaricaulis sp.]|nr:hypothetical protein [Candidatus Bipolaricaulis sp.]MDD5646544.1 hypothetical protein [Candidatus Bipolaricaulis sp.]
MISLDAHAHVKPSRTSEELGCYFSVHSAVARRSTFRTACPPSGS